MRFYRGFAVLVIVTMLMALAGPDAYAIQLRQAPGKDPDDPQPSIFLPLISTVENVRTQTGGAPDPDAPKPDTGEGELLALPGNSVAAAAVTAGTAIRDLPGFRTNALPRNDDGYSGQVTIGFPMNYFGRTYTSLFVNNNGNVTFDSGMSTYTPFDLTSTQRPIIAPFFADVDTRGSGSSVVTYGNDVVDGRPAFGVDWFGVGYYSNGTDKLNYFQLLLIDRSDTGVGNFDVEFNYNQIQWEAGSASGGSAGLGGRSARVGYSNGSGLAGTKYEFVGSSVPGSLLDSNANSGLIHGSQNSNMRGRYHFYVRSGAVGNGLSASTSTLPADNTSTATLALGGAPAGHRVRFLSSLPGVSFNPTLAVVNNNGAATALVRSGTPGDAVITVQDVDAGFTFHTYASIRFTSVSGSNPGVTLPPSSDIRITNVQSRLPLHGIYPSLANLSAFNVFASRMVNTVNVSVDWRGRTPGTILYTLNSINHSVPASTPGGQFTLHMGRDLQVGRNTLQIVARSADGYQSAPVTFQPLSWRSAEWIAYILSLPALGEISWVEGDRPRIEVEMALPPEEIAANIENLLPGKTGLNGWQMFSKFEIPVGDPSSELTIRGGARNFDEDEMSRAAGRRGHQGLVIFGDRIDVDYYLEGTGGFDANATPYLRTASFGLETHVTHEKRWSFLVLLSWSGAGAPVYQVIDQLHLDEFLKRYAYLYAQIGGTLGGQGTLNVQNLGLQGLEATLGLEIEGGMRIEAPWNSGEVHAFIGADGELVICYPNLRVCTWQVGGELGVKFRAGWWEKEFTMRYERSSDGVQAASPQLSETSESPWRLVRPSTYGTNTEFPAEPLRALTAAEAQVGATVITRLLTNIYPDPAPNLARAPNSAQALLLWTHDDPARPTGQGYDLRFSRWTGSSWSAPAAVTNDTYPDGDAQVVWLDAGHALAVWQRLNDASLDANSSLDVEQTRKFQLAWSRYDANTNSWSQPKWLTQDPIANAQMPLLAKAPNGTIWALWRSNPEGQLIGDLANPDRVLIARWNGNDWDEPQVIVDSIVGLGDLAFAHTGNQAVVVWAAMTETSPGAASTSQLFASSFNGSTWSRPIRLTSSPVEHTHPTVVYRQGQPYVIWLAGNVLTLVTLNSLQAQAYDAAASSVDLTAGKSVSLPANLQVDEINAIQDSGEDIFVVFSGQEDANRDLYLAYYDTKIGVWGNPQKLTDDRNHESHPAAILDANDQLLVAYSRTLIGSESRSQTLDGGPANTFVMPVELQTDLYTLRHSLRRDVAVTALSLSDSRPMPSSTIVISASVTNQGDVPLQNVQLVWRDNGSAITTRTLSQPLVAGTTTVVTATYVVPSSASTRQIEVVADPQNVIPETVENNNSFRQIMFGPDLVITSLQAQSWSVDTTGLVVIVSNSGNASAPGTTLSVTLDSPSTGPVITNPVPELAPGATYTLTTAWVHSALTSGDHVVVGSVNPSQNAFVEISAGNNVLTTTFRTGPDLMLDVTYSQLTTALTSTAVLTVPVFNIGQTASPTNTLHFYRRSDLSDASKIAVRSVPSLAPGQAVVIGLSTAGPLGCGVYVMANRNGEIPEVTRSNNAVFLVTPGGTCAKFIQTPLSAVAPATVEFSDVSTGNNTGWQWEFGDGATSTARNPSHTYTTPGLYAVTLRIAGANGTDQVTIQDAVRVYRAASAGFSAAQSQGVRPLSVTFTDQSIGDIASWNWDFGDGATSSVRNPVHIYTEPGRYTVKLSVAGPGGTNTITHSGLISVAASGPPTSIEIVPNLTTVFVDSASGTSIRILLQDGLSNPVANHDVHLSTTFGMVPGVVKTNAEGLGVVVLDAAGAIGTATVTAQAGQITASTTVRLIGTEVEGVVFRDTNRNGIQDVGEVGVPKTAISLKSLDGRLAQTTMTDGAGRYWFGGLPGGTYQVKASGSPTFTTGRTMTVIAGRTKAKAPNIGLSHDVFLPVVKRQ